MTTNEPPGSDGDPVNAAAETSTATRSRPFQFSMATGLAVVTGVTIILSLTAWPMGIVGLWSDTCRLEKNWCWFGKQVRGEVCSSRSHAVVLWRAG